MKLLLVGETWLGSNARSVHEAFQRRADVEITMVDTDRLAISGSTFLPRAANRILLPLQILDLKRRVLRACEDLRPDVILVYKGWHFDAAFVRMLKARFAPVVNIFPDPSPQIYGERMQIAMGEYDLVISAKKYHPPIWKTRYGYSNRCVHVSHAYDPRVHLRNAPNTEPRFDVVLVATWRSPYEALIRDVHAKLGPLPRGMAIGGAGWNGRGIESLTGVTLAGQTSGAGYIELLRQGAVTIAPVQAVVEGEHGPEPGDEVSSRTFECAAACTFFVHLRTAEAAEFYDEESEVPMFDGADELADKIRYFLAADEKRGVFAAAAHRRAVPRYSYDGRVEEMMVYLQALVVRTPASASARA